MKAKEKPAYESPKVSRLDYKETLIGSVAPVTCEPGSSATGNCTNIGNSAIASCINGTAAEGW